MEGLIESIALLTIFCLKVLVLVVVAGITLTAIIVVVTFIRVVVKEVVLGRLGVKNGPDDADDAE